MIDNYLPAKATSARLHHNVQAIDSIRPVSREASECSSESPLQIPHFGVWTKPRKREAINLWPHLDIRGEGGHETEGRIDGTQIQFGECATAEQRNFRLRLLSALCLEAALPSSC